MIQQSHTQVEKCQHISTSRPINEYLWYSQRRKEGEGKVSQSCPTLRDPTDCSPPGSSVHGIFQARVLEWVAISFSQGSSQPRDRTRSPALQTDVLPSEPPGQATLITLSGNSQNLKATHVQLVHRKKSQYIHKVKYYSVINGNELLKNTESLLYFKRHYDK